MTLPNLLRVNKEEPELLQNGEKIPRAYYYIIFAVSVLTLLICTKSSPLYPFNDWVDSNIYFTAGKSLFNGKVLYRDVFDHKGPVIFFLHAITWLISNKTFFGVFILEVVTAFFFLLYSYKTMLLFVGKKSIIMIPVLSAVVYSSKAMCHGDSAEELCLPMLMYAIYIIVKSFKNDTEMTNRELFILGITSGFVFWLKFTLAGFYAGFIVVPFFCALFEKNYKYIGKMILRIFMGIMTITLPIILYFAVTGSLFYLWDVYFYTNIFVYTDSSTLLATIGNLFYRAGKIFCLNLGVWVPILLGSIWLFFTKHRKILLQMFFMYITGIVMIYTKGDRTYYAFIFSVFCFMGMIAFYDIGKKLVNLIKNKRLIKKLYVPVFVLLFILIIPVSLIFSSNTYLLSYEKEDLPQFRFAEIINQKENPSLLNYGFLDGGFYTTTGIVPNCRFFCKVNLDLPEMMEMQNYYVDNGLVDFVVTRGQDMDFEKYEKCAESAFEFEGHVNAYFLYKLKDNK